MLALGLLGLSLATSVAAADAGRMLTFDERVAAQKALERVHYAYQSGATRPFEVAWTRRELEGRVQHYSALSAALERRWGVPVTGEMLRAELERIARDTRMPERLLQVYAALGNDPVLIQECFARPVLVERLARNFFAFDRRIHEEARERADQVSEARLDDPFAGPAVDRDRAEIEVELDLDGAGGGARSVAPRTGPGDEVAVQRRSLPAPQFRALRDQFPSRAGKFGPVVEERDRFTIRVLVSEEEGRFRGVVYSIPKLSWDRWLLTESVGARDSETPPVVASHEPLPYPRAGTKEAERGSTDQLGATNASPALESFCLPDDSWSNASLDDALEPRARPSAVWTGTEMIVWGASGVSSGSRYNPLTDTWTPTSQTNAPQPRQYHTGVWTGDRMIVWGGTATGVPGVAATGGRYDPVTDAWAPTSLVNAPQAREGHHALWTGSRMVIWGGDAGSGYLNTGGRYDPAADVWSPTSTVNTPLARGGFSTAWTGTEMIIWGGENISVAMNGGRYNPTSDVWTSVSTVNAPSSRYAHSAIWTGSRMVVWGGYWEGSVLATGGRYDPGTDSWSSTSTAGAPSARYAHTAVWAGGRMLIWGGSTGSAYLNSGGRYNPIADSWQPISDTNSPEARWANGAVSTGTQMIIWGGGQTLAVNTGGRYDLASDTWTPTSTGTAPSPRYSNTATWTGNSMVVWGGAYTGGGYLATGGRYDPLLDSWSPTSTIDAPSPRQAHSAVWTGIELIIWGGGDGAPIGSGARYDPVFDRWQPLSAIGAPVARAGHSAVWTGTRMIVWGGSDGAARVNTGGSYDPLGDTWTPLSTLNAPIPRFRHTAVWTGTVMIVWGGSTTSLGTNTGGRYDPILDTWTATSLASAPSARDDHTAVWSGSRMVVWGGYGGGYLASGGRYNPAADTWTPTSSIGAPYARSLHTAVWTAQEMIVWGGSGPASPNGTFNSGGRYDPTGDSWLPTSTAGAPPARDQLRAVWTGSLMIVWGGNLFTGGGQYAIGHARDDDDDGYTECGGDCDDANPGRAPGTAEICNGIDDNCDGVVPLSEADADSDGVPACLFDCDDENAASYPGNPEICDNIDNDCDGSVDGYTTLCGVGGCARAGACTSGIDTCVPGTPVAEACDGVDNDCNGAIPSAESDLDHDGFAGCAGDCDDTDPERYSGALELNNGQDDQCPGDAGSGLIDEVSGSLVFSDPATLCWPPQGGATSYELGRSADRAFPVGCATFQSASACIVDSAVPPSRGVFYYLVRSVSPFLGSWDATSSGERVGACDPGHFVLHDTLANDAAPDALAQFFSITPATTSDYLHFGIVGGSLPGFEWCAERADFYRDSYLELAATDGGANSGGWQVWFRRAGEAWTGPSVETHFNAYGDSCFGPYSWCSEILLDDRSLVANPADVGQCEANDLVYGCGDGTATLTITIGPDRVSACGF